jgi:hypothetical protein
MLSVGRPSVYDRRNERVNFSRKSEVMTPRKRSAVAHWFTVGLVVLLLLVLYVLSIGPAEFILRKTDAHWVVTAYAIIYTPAWWIWWYVPEWAAESFVEYEPNSPILIDYGVFSVSFHAPRKFARKAATSDRRPKCSPAGAGLE